MAKLRITLTKSPIGYEGDQRRCAESLGLRRLHQSVEHDDGPSVRGAIRKIRHLVQVEEMPEGGGSTAASRS